MSTNCFLTSLLKGSSVIDNVLLVISDNCPIDSVVGETLLQEICVQFSMKECFPRLQDITRNHLHARRMLIGASCVVV